MKIIISQENSSPIEIEFGERSNESGFLTEKNGIDFLSKDKLPTEKDIQAIIDESLNKTKYIKKIPQNY